MSPPPTQLARRGALPPVRRLGPWLTWGLVLQVIGAAIPVVTAIRRAHREGLGASLSHYTVTLIGRQMLHSNADVALVVVGVIVFAAGSVVLARPFVRHRLRLLVAVPIAAVVGLAAFGVLAVILAALAVLVGELGDVGGGDTSGGGGIFDVLSGLYSPSPRSDDNDDEPRRRRRRR